MNFSVEMLMERMMINRILPCPKVVTRDIRHATKAGTNKGRLTKRPCCRRRASRACFGADKGTRKA